MAKKNYEEREFKNSIGQVIQPGDKVLVITEGYCHSVKTRIGKYLGITPSGLATCEVEASWWNLGAMKRGTKRTTPILQRIYKLA